VPPLADCFGTRPESAPSLSRFGPGETIVFTPGHLPLDSPLEWWGGTGKTQLAVYCAESLWQARELDLLLWVPASSRASVVASYTAAQAQIAGADCGDDADAVARRFLNWLVGTTQRWLVVLDDICDQNDLDGLWPGGPAGRVIATTRVPAALMAGAGRRVFQIGPFSPREALNYLTARLATEPGQRIGAVDLADDLACQPLALAQASALIAGSGLSCRDYRGYYARRRDQILKTTGEEPSAVGVTWTLSLERAGQLTPSAMARSALAFTSLLDSHGVPAPVLTSAAACEYITGRPVAGQPDPKPVRGALINLDQVGLVSIDPASTSRTVRMSAVVQASIRAALPPAVRGRAGKAAADALLQAWPPHGERSLLAQALRSCAAELRDAAPEALWEQACHPVLFRAGTSLHQASMASHALAYWQALAADAEQRLGPEHADTMRARDHLASAFLAAGRADEAIRLSEGIAEVRTATLGPDHPDTLAARDGLARACLAAGQIGNAIALLERLLVARERLQGPEHEDTLAARGELAAGYRAAGRLKDAIRLFEHTLAGQERVLGPDHPDTMTTRGNLAYTYRSADRLKDALPHYKRTLADRERVLGPDHPDTLAARGNLASAYHSARRVREAVPLYEQLLADRERIQGPDHPDTLAARGNLASAYHSAGRMAAAIPLYEQTRAACERVLGAGHPDTLTAQANLAQAYHTVGRLAEAIELLQRTVEDCERMLHPGHPLTRAVRESLEVVAAG
jgi:tetratricopeptide (TPR) repeat protein